LVIKYLMLFPLG